MKWMSYLLWRFAKAEDTFETLQGKKLSALIRLSGLLLIHVLSIVFLLSTVLDNNWDNFGLLNNHDGFYSRKIKSALIALPVFLIILIVLSLKRKRVDAYFKLFENMNSEEKKKYNRRYVVYWIVTLVVFFGSIVSGAIRNSS